MNILLTSGGTRVAIDDVRSITNFSTGNFGKRIATAALVAGHKVTHLVHKDAPHPFKLEVDLVNGRGKDFLEEHEALHNFAFRNYSRYSHVPFDTYDDYAHNLKERCTNWQYDAVILCAAVSDAKPVPYSGKLATENVNSIPLVPTEKLISRVREWQANALIMGFKLMSNVGMLQLTDTARKSLQKNHLDFVLANDLKDLKGEKKLVYLCNFTKSGIYFANPIEDTSAEISKKLILALELQKEGRYNGDLHV